MQEEEILAIFDKRYNLIKEIPGIFNYYGDIDYEYFKDCLSLEDFKTALRVRNRKKQRRKRCFKKLEPVINEYIKSYINGDKYCNLVFGTCTFNDKELKFKEETRTKKVNLWLKRHFKVAIANIDYGEKNDREHQHFVGLTYEPLEPTNKRGKNGFELYELKIKDYTLGFEPDLEIINLSKMQYNDFRKLSNYLVKINFHSNKKTTKNRRIRVIKK